MWRWLIAGLAVAAAVVAVIAVSGGSEPDEPTAAPRRDTVGADLAALQRIADDNGETRAAGSAGDHATSEYLVRRLREAGYRVTTQRFSVPFYRERRPPRLLVGGRRVKDITAFQFSPAGRVTGRVRQVDDLGCDAADYGALRDGEIALVRRGDCFFVIKVALARRAGAAAVLIANDSGSAPTPGSLLRPGSGGPVLGVTRDANLAGRRVTVHVRAISETRETENVVAETGAEDPRRVVMAGAHHDSVTAGPGLNDDGSGTVLLLALADRIPADRLPDDTALRLGFWAAEEIGLVGSRRYVDRLGAVERSRIVGYFNFDMVGSPGADLKVYDTDDRMEQLMRRRLGRDAPEELLEGNSDHASFEAKDIPVTGIFTGLDDCYHQACDTLGNVDRAVLARSVRAAEAAVVDLADR